MSEQKILYDGLHDPQFTKPYVDVDEWRDVPVRVRRPPSRVRKVRRI